MGDLRQIQSLKILLEGINDWENGIRLTLVEDENKAKVTILPAINNVGPSEQDIKIIKDKITSRILLNGLDLIELTIFGNDSQGYKIVATEKIH